MKGKWYEHPAWAWGNIAGNIGSLALWGLIPALFIFPFRLWIMLINAFFVGIGVASVVMRQRQRT